MRSKYAAIATLTLMLLGTAWSFSSNATRILLLNSYHPTLSWTDSLNYGILKTLGQSGINFEIYTENLDLKRNQPSLYISQYTRYIESKYKQAQIELIIVTDNDALNYIEQIRYNVFPGVPVVFCGVNNQYLFAPNTTGVIEEVNLERNLELIATQHPKIKKVYCIVDQTTTGKIIEKTLYGTLLRKAHPFDVEIITNITTHELMARVKEFEPQTAILYVFFNQDIEGNYLPYEAILDSLNKYTTLPIYGVWSFYIKHGIIGGHVISGHDHGRMAAEIAIKICTGTPTDSIKPVIGSTKYVFDYRIMQKHRIKLGQLPKNSVIINNPYNFLKQHKALVAVFVSLFIVLLVIIYLLIIINRNRQRLLEVSRTYNQDLEEKNTQIKESLSKAEEANMLKSAFLANMSHEIRTPLNAIVGFAKLIQTRPDLTDNEVDNFMNIIVENSHRLLNLINDIIDISKIEANQLRFNIRNTHLNPILTNCITNAQIEKDRLKKDNVSLKLITTPTIDEVEVLTDPDRVSQVISNFLNNAIKFTDNGKIILSCLIIKGWIEISVTDTGIGIDQSHKAVIFDRFRQVDNLLTRKYGGSGLGLSICKGIIFGLGGEIGLESELDIGSGFWFRIPLNVSQPIPSTAANIGLTQPNQLANKNILIVEDNESTEKLLSEALKKSKANLIITNNAEEAIEICRISPNLNIVLMDIRLPGINGYEAIRIIKEIRPELPIIVQTANAMSDEREQAIALGCNDYITKPYDAETILTTIEKYAN
ncbi:MAG: response regulator [Bacteroidales bacterium]|nr:response regulator [Bacteroidales bacterium]